MLLYARKYAYPCQQRAETSEFNPGRGYAQQTIHPHDQADADGRINAATVKSKRYRRPGP
jgi:hypothetical protein